MGKSVQKEKSVKDYREAIELAEKRGELVRVKKEVEPLLELPSVSRAIGENSPSCIPTILFENIAGYPHMRGCSAIFSEFDRAISYFGLSGNPAEVKEYFLHAIENPIKPELVSTGPCKENIVTGDIDIQKMIFPTRGAVQSQHLYYQPVVVTRHPETGEYNMGVYRATVQGKDRVTVNLRWVRHGGMHLIAAKEKGVPLEVALCIGCHPAVYIAAVTKMTYDEDEFRFAGGIIGEPLSVVKCETLDMFVPASSEIVIEGVLKPPYDLGTEGPWPEYLGYLGMDIKPPIMDITAVTHRDNPINNLLIPKAPPYDSIGLGNAARFLKHLRNLAGEFVVDARLTAQRHHAIIKVKKTEMMHEGLQIDVAMAALTWGAVTVDNVTLVDEDIDIYNYGHVNWAMVTRCNPTNQVHVLPESRSHRNNPIAGVRETEGNPITRGNLIIDATMPWKYKIKEKGDGISFFTLSKWNDVNLQDYLGDDDLKKLKGTKYDRDFL